MKHLLRNLSAFLLVTFACTNLWSQPLTGYTVSPLPALECSTTTVTINGTLPCGNAVIQGTSHTYVGSTLFVDVFILQPIICLPIILPYTVTETVGNIPAGSYTVTIRYYENGLNLATLNGSLNVGSCCSVNSAFTASSLIGCPGDSLTFTAADPSLANYTWTLGGNVISTGPVAGFTFPTTGTFPLSLDGGDGTCTTSTSQTISVGTSVNAGISTISFPKLCPGESVPFASTSTGATQYEWFANGQPFSQMQNATYVFADTGTIVINLLASNASCHDTASQSFQVSAPIITGIISDESCSGSMNGSIDINTTSGILPYSFLWSNGAMTEDLSQLTGGDYVLTVTDSLGCTDSDTLTVAAAVGIAAEFSASGASEVCPGATLDFSNTSTPGSSATWLSDGTPFASTMDASFVFPDSGSVEITLIASLSVCADTTSSIFTIIPAPAVAVLLSPETCPESEDGGIELSLSGGTMPFTFAWSNGATTEDLMSLSPGTYDLLLGFGTSCEWRDTFVIETAGGIEADFNFQYVPNGVQFTDLSGATASNWAWDFGDGVGSSNVQNPLYEFMFPGIYEVCLVVIDSFGCSDTLCEMNDFTTGLGERTLLQLSGYPNPVQDEYQLDLSSISGKPITVKLYDGAGRLVVSRQEQASTQLTLRLGQLPSGLYHLLLLTDEGYFETSIQKQ